MSFISTALPRITAIWPQRSPGEQIERQVVWYFGQNDFSKTNPRTSQLQVVIYNNQRWCWFSGRSGGEAPLVIPVEIRIHKYQCTNTQIHKYRCTNTNTQIHKYTNINAQIPIHKYTNTQIPIHKYKNTQIQVGRHHWLQWSSTPAAAAVHTQGECCQGSRSSSSQLASFTSHSPSQGVEPDEPEVQQLPWHHHLHQQVVCLGWGGHDGDQYQDNVDGDVQDVLLCRVRTLAKETVEVHSPLPRTVQQSSS